MPTASPNPNPNEPPEDKDHLQSLMDGDPNVDYNALLAQLEHDHKVLTELEESYKAEAADLAMIDREEKAILKAVETGDRAAVAAAIQQAEDNIKAQYSGEIQALHLRAIAKLRAVLDETPLTWMERIRKAFGRPLR